MANDKSSPRVEGILVAILFIAIGVGYAIYGARSWFPELASRHGSGIDAMITFVLVATGLMFLIGHLVFGWLIWRAAARDRVTSRLAEPRAERRISITVGIVIALAAEGGVIAIGLPVFGEYYGDIPLDAVDIEVTGQQFAWNNHYPGADGVRGRTDVALITPTNPVGLDNNDPASADDIVAVNQLTVPVDRPVKITLRALDVIHSFYLPHHRVKQDAVPGMSIPVWFIPTREGRFEIPCAELCGLGHYRMKGFLNVVSQAEYEAWLDEQAGS
ncbi:MAG: cytochrome-c oxidase [Acidobacteria bacterium]|nr:cytochrome-c oxidase [Acidobacteriota bacterium]